MTDLATRNADPTVSTSLLLPSGASLSVVAALIEGLGEGNVNSQLLAVLGAAATVAAWSLVARRRRSASSELGIRFFSILAIALAITSLLLIAGGGWLGMVGLTGLWLAALGAGVEWMRGRTYGTEA
jgi:hypothetical protein